MKKIDFKRLKDNIEQSFSRDTQNGKLGGAAVCVFQDGEMLYNKCFSGDVIKVNENTLFRLASMTKPVTAVAVMKLVERGLISLDEPVCTYIPSFVEMYIGKVIDGKAVRDRKAQTPITLRHVLTHTSGIGSGPVGDIIVKTLPSEKRENLDFMMKHFTDNLLDFEPATAQAYSGTYAFDVAARVIEIVSGKRYDEFLRTEIFEPLGMTDTGFVPNDAQWERMVPMHNLSDGKGAVAAEFERCVFAKYPEEYFCAGAGLFSSLADYSRFALMLQNGGELDGVRILKKESIDEISTPHVPESIMTGNERWGLSVRVITKEAYGLLPIGAYGWSGAYGSHFWIDPVNRITVIFMRNSLFDGGSGSAISLELEKNVFNSME